ncbi:MAG: hypothetical protein QF416_06465 [Candidatus Marinimicrobia bacterium]|jgi:hypothetical protein|nr:hypothetical protein [Candidatus Neomarinimicrobiota bacterium]|tara:strand:- start:6975 stop:8156 length:1182 start_codon:yes stop_codon:yes gene_type:complete
MKKIFTTLMLVLAPVFGQVIDFTVDFTPYVIYYLSAVDISTGESNVPLFLARLERTQSAPDSVPVHFDFEITVQSDALGFYEEETLVHIKTKEESPLILTAPITMTNQMLTLDTRQLLDDAGNLVNMNLEVVETVDLEQTDELLNAVIATGRLPDGIYRFMVTATPEGGSPLMRDDVLNVSSPLDLQLIAPGGALADTASNEIYTSYPVFQWDSDPCMVPGGCEFLIRVAEFIPSDHSSVEQAIESTTRLPLDQSLGFYATGYGATSFQYPSSGAGDLEPGSVYVWQIKKILPTTFGEEELLSEILTFKVKDFSEESDSDDGADGGSDMVIQLLQTLLDEGDFEQIFGENGSLSGYSSTGTILLNGSSTDNSTVQAMISEGLNDKIISVEVSE